jgi:hypothetical protein
LEDAAMTPDTTWTVDGMPDMAGETVVVTGANSGLGYEATKAFVRAGAAVVMACRSTDRGDDARRRIERRYPDASLAVSEVDLANLESVRTFAERFDDEHDELHVLCNNAGIMAVPRSETTDGFETQFGVNHLGHFALTELLLDHLRETDGETRVVTQSSSAHRMGRIDFGDLHGERSYGKWRAYGQSKLANLLFAYELDRRLRRAGSETISVACHPGYAATDLQATGPRQEGAKRRERLMGLLNRIVAQSAEMGALPMLYAATAKDVDGGDYIGPGGFMESRGHPTHVSSNERSHSHDVATRLWTVSEELTGVDYEFD